MAHSPERRKYLTNWGRQHREKLRALPLAALKKLRATVYTMIRLPRGEPAPPDATETVCPCRRRSTTLAS